MFYTLLGIRDGYHVARPGSNMCPALCCKWGSAILQPYQMGPPKGSRFCDQKEEELLGNQQQRYPLTTADTVLVYRKPKFLIHLE